MIRENYRRSKKHHFGGIKMSEKAKKEIISQEDMMKLLDKLYDNSIQGIPQVSPPIEEVAEQYLSKNADVHEAAKSFINYQIAKCTTSGFVTGLGGLITLPVAVPANIGSVLYVQMRMIACLAYMGGYDLQSDQVQTLVYACLAGLSLDTLAKQLGVKLGTKMATSLVKKIPGKVLTKINQKVGFRLVTKFGTKGVVNLGKAIPIVGGVISGGLDFAETKVIGDRAYKMFVLHDFSCQDKDDDFIELEDFEEETANNLLQESIEKERLEEKKKFGFLKSAEESGKKAIINIKSKSQSIINYGKSNRIESKSEELDSFEKLKKLKELLDMGIITQEEFDMKKKELLEL